MPDDLTFPVEAGHIMRFAAAIGDENPIYRDAAHAQATEPGGVIAPPTYAVVSSHWDPATSRDPSPADPGGAPPPAPPASPAAPGPAPALAASTPSSATSTTGPSCAGETLSVRKRPGKPPGRRRAVAAGAMTFEETISEFFDEAGEIVVTATMRRASSPRASSISRGRPCEPWPRRAPPRSPR